MQLQLFSAFSEDIMLFDNALRELRTHHEHRPCIHEADAAVLG